MKPEPGQIWINRIGDSVFVTHENDMLYRCKRFDPEKVIEVSLKRKGGSRQALDAVWADRYFTSHEGDICLQHKHHLDLIKRDFMSESTQKRIVNLVITSEGPRYLRHGQIWKDSEGRTIWTIKVDDSDDGTCGCYQPWDGLKPSLTGTDPLYYVSPRGVSFNQKITLVEFLGWWESPALSSEGTRTQRTSCETQNESNIGKSEEVCLREVLNLVDPPPLTDPTEFHIRQIQEVTKELGIPSRLIGDLGSKHPEQIPMAGGKAASTKGPAFHLIPTEALAQIADRFELGIARKGDRAWNALSKNQEILTNREFVIERISHIIHHAMKLRDKINNSDFEGMKEDSDAGAIAWGGVFLLSAVSALLKENQNEPTNCDAEPTAY